MKIFQRNSDSKNRKQEKRSLIRILYIYPVAFFLVGLSTIITYYTWLQINEYNKHVEKLKSEFPEKQRTALKSRVLVLKDYIGWVKSHPDEYTIQMLNNRILIAEHLFSSYKNDKNFSSENIPVGITDSLDEANKRSIIKIIILNNNNEVIYPQFPFRHKEGEKTSKIIESVYKLENYDRAVSLIKNSYLEKTPSVPYLIIKKSKIDDLNIGITFDASQKKSIIQEVVLDSLSKVKYPNNEYVIINTFDGFALLSKGKRQIPPINIKNSTETNWKDVFTKELEFAKQMNGGYYTYLWRNNPDVERSEKTSYFSGINDWEWIIGTGFFTSDIYPVLEKLKAELYTDIRNNLIRFFIFLIILIVLAQLTMRYFAVKAKSNILLFLHFFKRAAQGMQIIDSNQLAFSEFDTLAQAANQMIHERERIKSVLSAEKSRLRYMIDAIPDLIFFKDTESKFLGCNTAFEKYINKKSEEIIGLSEYELFRKSDATGYNKSDKRIIETLQPERSTNWVEYSNGERCLFYTLKTPYFDSEKNLLGIIGISRDITEMEETRQRLILAKEKAEESDKLKTAFLANMSHEIRTPMNAIIGFSDLLAEDDLTHEDKIDFISKIKGSGRSLMSLINDIIDIAKIEAGQLKVVESACDLNLVLNDLLGTFEELKNVSGKKSVGLNLVVPEKINNFWVITDPCDCSRC
jgi:PAS domain S-box-containing protein